MTSQTETSNDVINDQPAVIDTTRTQIPTDDVTSNPNDGGAPKTRPGVMTSQSNQIHPLPDVRGEDEIGVTLDYEFPAHPDYERENDVTRPTSNVTSQRSRRRRRRRRRERVGFLEFYRKHWFGQFASGMFTGLIFLVIGLVFIIVFNELPTYIGVLFILVSFPPCCLSVNRLRHARAAERLRRENMNRLRTLRRMHRQARAEANNDRHLPFTSDLPPAYNNLGYVGNEAELETGEVSRGSSMTSSELSETDLPSYEEAIRIKQEIEEELARERESQQRHHSNNTKLQSTSPPSHQQQASSSRGVPQGSRTTSNNLLQRVQEVRNMTSSKVTSETTGNADV